MEDRGGLKYQIEVNDRATASINSVIDRIKALKGELTSLNGSLKSVGTSGGGGGGKRGQARPTALTDLEKAQRNDALSTLKKIDQINKEAKKISSEMEANFTKAQQSASKVNSLRVRRFLESEAEVQQASKKASAQLRADLEARAAAEQKAIKASESLKANQIKQFLQQEELARRASKKASDELKKDMQARAKPQQTFDAEKVRQAQQENLRLTQEEDKARARIAKEQKAAILANEKARKAEELRLQKLATAEEARAIKARQYNDISLQAQNRIQQTERAIAIDKAAVAQLAQKASISQRAAAEQLGISAQRAKQLGINMVDVEHAARQFLFTFRRLVGILAVFTAARKLAQAISLGVREMSRFNGELETAQIGIAQIIASVGQIQDSTGQLVTGPEAFNEALLLSRDIIDKLKKDALTSVATFEGLTKAFQVAVGPGLAAGLDLNQIREVSLRLTEGAQALGLPLNQLSEEIRSLLQGTATARNTRLAVLFGGAEEANKAIRQATEQGNLYEVLIDKLRGVEQGARAAERSLAQLQSNLQDTVQLLLAEGGIEQFNAVKEAIDALTKSLRTVDTDGNIIFNPAALKIVQEVAGTLADLSRTLREVTDTDDTLNAFANTLGVIRSIVTALAPVVFALLQGAVNGVNAVLQPINILIKAAQSIIPPFRGLRVSLLGIVKLVATIVTATYLWRTVLLSIAALKGIGTLFTGIRTAIIASTAALSAFNGGLITASTLMTILKAKSLAAAAVSILASAGWALAIGALLALVYLLLDAFGLVDKAANAFNKSLEKFGGGLDPKLLASIKAVNSALEQGKRTTEEWADELLKARQAADIAESLRGLTGLSRELVSIVQEETKAHEARNKAALKQLEIIEKRRIALTTPNRRVAIGGPEEQLNVVKRLDADIDARLEIEVALREELQKTNEVIRERVRATLAEKTALNELQAVALSEANAQKIKAATEDTRESSARLFNAQAETSLLEAQVALKQKERSLELATLQASIADTRNADIQVALEEELLRKKAVNAALSEAENIEIQRKTELLKQQRAVFEGDVRAVFADGFQNFYNELPALGEELSKTISAALSDVAGVVAGVFKDAVDPRTSPDIKTAFGEFFLDLAGTFVEQITRDLIAKGISTLLDKGVDAASDAPQIAATSANTAAITANTAAITALTTTTATAQATDTATTAASGAADVAGAASKGVGFAESFVLVPLLTAMLTTFTALMGTMIALQTAQVGLLTSLLLSTVIGGLMAAVGSFVLVPFLLTQIGLQTVMVGLMVVMTGLLAAILAVSAFDAVTPFKKGGLVQGLASGGKVKGYAGGGTAKPFPRPSYIPASDTVPAWLTPGEYVLPVKAVKKIGLNALEALRMGVMPPSFKAAGNFLSNSSNAIRGYAVGGSVMGTPAMAGNVGGGVTVLPVLPTTNNNLEQMLSGGRKAFTKNVNSVNYTGDPNRSGSW